jgi:hypothetical protein
MQKICHVERFICTETPVEADGIQTFFLFEMSRTTKRQAKQQLGGNPFSPKYSEPRTKWVVQLFVYGVGLTLVGGSTLVGLRAAKPPLPSSTTPAVPSAAAVTSAEFSPSARQHSAGHSFAERQSLARVCRCAEWGQQPEALLPLPYPYPRV